MKGFRQFIAEVSQADLARQYDELEASRGLVGKSDEEIPPEFKGSKLAMTPAQFQHLHLSNQARWYFNSRFPVHCGVMGHADPEPKAMQELIAAGLVASHKGAIDRRLYYSLTDDGNKFHKKAIAEARHFDLMARRWNIDKIDQYVAQKKLKPTTTINPKDWIDSEWGRIIHIDKEHAITDKVDISKPLYLAKVKNQQNKKEVFHIVIDGWHRMFKASQQGVTSLPCIIIDGDNPRFLN